MVAGLYRDNNETVRADTGSDFFDYMNCTDTNPDEICEGTAFDYITWFFDGIYGQTEPITGILVLAAFLIVGRLGTWVALRFIRHA